MVREACTVANECLQTHKRIYHWVAYLQDSTREGQRPRAWCGDVRAEAETKDTATIVGNDFQADTMTESKLDYVVMK